MPKVFRYKVLAGTHVVGETAYGPTSPNGSIFETERDLSHHNLPGLQPRFELLESKPITEKVEEKSEQSSKEIESAAKPKSQDDGLDTQTIQELRAFAADAKIDILGLNRKDEIIAAIRRAVASS